MEWIYLSPHLDDVALSCGGLVWTQATGGDKVSIWTICAGDQSPGELSSFAESIHQRWEITARAPEKRRSEDRLSCQRLGASPSYFSVPDGIYRRSPTDGTWFYDTDEALFGELNPQEASLIMDIRLELLKALPQNFRLVCPLAVGGHVDHRLVKAAAQSLDLSLWYYADYPYVIDYPNDLPKETESMRQVLFPISSQALDAWIHAVAAHASQISTFWQDPSSMEREIRDYHQTMGGIYLWQKE